MKPTWITIVFLAASCAAADARPKVPIPVLPPALPEFIDGADAAKMLESKIAIDAARLRWIAAVEAFETKYKIKIGLGDGWDEVDGEGKPCGGADCRLRIRRAAAPAAKPATAAPPVTTSPPAPRK